MSTEAIDYFHGEELPAKAYLDKYALRAKDDTVLEPTPVGMHRRLASNFARIEARKFRQPLGEDELFGLFDGFGEIIPQGSPMYGIGNPQLTSLSNCYVVESPQDSYGGIHLADQRLTQISKRRGGVGMDLSNLRPAGALTTNSARSSSGVVAFAQRYSNSIREVGQNGRRGALMLTLSVHHPDVLAFAGCKSDRKNVTGANISIRLTNEFLNAVDADTDYEQRWPVEGKPVIRKMVSARAVWKELIHYAWESAEPGLLFWDRIISESPADCYADLGFRTVSTNPCQPGWATVLTPDGVSPIWDVGAGSVIWAPGGWRQVAMKWNRGVEEVWAFETEGGILYATRAHMVYSNGNKVPAGEAKSIDACQMPDEPSKDRVSHPVLSFWSVGRHDVYDLTLETEPQAYWSGGLCVANCGELPLCPDDSCRLLLLNLFSFVRAPFTSGAYFDFDYFYARAQTAQRLMDDLVDLELEAIDRILVKIASDPEPEHLKEVERSLWQSIRKKCADGRRTGTGITALGDAMAAVGIRYGSEESIVFTEKVYKTLKLGCYRASVDMAMELGPFPIWDKTREESNPFLLRIKDEDPVLYADMQKYGRRNIALLTTAPAGTTSLVAGPRPYFGTTSGGEPLFTDEPYTRRKKITPSMGDVHVDFVDESGDRWSEFKVFHSKIRMWMDVTGETDHTRSPYHGCCANDINWQTRVRIQAAAQRHIDHSISSTINLPKDVTEETVATIYETAWKEGCKGITVYRDGCRDGVLVRQGAVPKTKAPKRPSSLPCEVHHLTAKKEPFAVVVGLMGGSPYEVFAFTNTDRYVASSVHNAQLHKHKRGQYDLLDKEGNSLLRGTDSLTGLLDETEEALTRMVSTALRHGAELRFIVQQLEKTRGDLQSFSKALARVLKKYITDGQPVTGEACQSCGKEALQRQEGCVSCRDCGWSKC